MTNEESIEIIKVARAEVEWEYPMDYAAAFDKAIEALEKEPKWIPVSERLPKAGEYVGDAAKYYLVQNEYGDMLVARYTHGDYWEQIYQLKPIGDEIVAWMPLPKPYEPQKSEVNNG